MGIEDLDNKKREKPKNMVEIETNNAIYRVFYQNHSQPINPSDVENADGIIFEGVTNYDSYENALWTLNCLAQINSRDVLQRIAELRKPVFLVDVSFESDKALSAGREYVLKKMLLPSAEFILGSTFIKSAFSKIKDPEPINRREFLKRGGKMLAGAYLVSPAGEIFSALGGLTTGEIKNESSLLRKSSRALGNINELIHPESHTTDIQGRNNLIAQKSETVAKMLGKELDKKPIISILIGAGHFGIEKTLQTGQTSRMNQIAKYFGSSLGNEGKIACFELEITTDGKIVCNSIKISEDPLFHKK